MGTIISKIEDIDGIRWTQLRKGRVTKAKRVLCFNDMNHAIVELENGEFTVIGGRHTPNGNWAVLSYGLDKFTQAVLYGLSTMGILTKSQVKQHIDATKIASESRDRNFQIKRVKELCEELGVEPPQFDTVDVAGK